MLDQNPFSLYDFLGYFVPGSVFLFMLYFLDISVDTTFEIRNVLYCMPEVNVGGALFFILSAYITGHILSYLSSIMIEKFANILYGYPSKYILGIQVDFNFKIVATIICFLFLFPSFLVVVLLRMFGVNFLNKKVDVFIKQSLEKKVEVLLKKILKLDYQNYLAVTANEKVDIHRIITHYVFDNSKQHQRKMVNYVSLYGLLRTLCLIFGILCILLLVFRFKQPQFLMHYTISSIFCLLCFMAFMKFYRRYTLEGLMLLIITDFRKK